MSVRIGISSSLLCDLYWTPNQYRTACCVYEGTKFCQNVCQRWREIAQDCNLECSQCSKQVRSTCPCRRKNLPFVVRMRITEEGRHNRKAPELPWEIHSPSISHGETPEQRRVSINKIVAKETENVAQKFTQRNGYRPDQAIYVAEWSMWIAGPVF